MTTPQKAQLIERAHRMLTDDRQHSRAARRWAERELGMPHEDSETQELHTHRFTPAEVLLSHIHVGAFA